MPSVSVIILNYHGLENTIACVKSLQVAQNSADLKIVVVNVDDDSVERSKSTKVLHDQFPKIDVLERKNLGFSGGNNEGAIYALHHYNPDYLLFLNNDTRVDPSAIRELVSFAQHHNGELAAYAPKIYFESGYEFHKHAYESSEHGNVFWYAGGLVDRKNVYAWHRGVDEVDLGQFDRVQETGFVTGCCMLVSRRTYRKVGGWNTKYFLYLEDLDYSERIRRRKGKLWYVPQAKIWHKNAGSTGGSGSQQHMYYQTRNRLYFGLKYAGMRTKVALVKEVFTKLKHGTHSEKIGLIDALFCKMGRNRYFDK